MHVGPELQEFYLYKELACYYSSYFTKIFDREPSASSFAGTESRKTKLDDVAVLSFEVFFRWLESQRFDGARQARWEDLANLYILASETPSSMRFTLGVAQKSNDLWHAKWTSSPRSPELRSLRDGLEKASRV